MSALLPTNLRALLGGRRAESARLELKARWDPETTGPQALATICAFANDHLHLNGGYLVLGVAEEEGRAVLPPRGLSDPDMQAAAKWIRGACNRLDPAYQPVVSPEAMDGRNVLVVWAPASELRPHSAPGGRRRERMFWIRLGAETVDAAANGLLPALLRQTARVPWDDRRAEDAAVADLREARVREFLRDVGSRLQEFADPLDTYRRMRITTRVKEHDAPRNVGLLFFADDPSRWFRGAAIELARFPDGPAASTLDEHAFRGGLADQLRRCLTHLESLSEVRVEKSPDTPFARRTARWPAAAVREALVNAVYHRSYEADAPDPVKVYVYPDRMTITSYPGPAPGIEAEHFEPGAPRPNVPARNRRIGEFLKDLELAEARLTGLDKIHAAMERNGSPPPRFEFDEGRTYFTVVLPVHRAHCGLAGADEGGGPG